MRFDRRVVHPIVYRRAGLLFRRQRQNTIVIGRFCGYIVAVFRPVLK